jgi:hypothetical protein
VLSLAAFEIAVCVGLGLLLQPQHLGFYWGLGIGVAIAAVGILADSPPHHIERWRQGAEGEKATAKALRKLVGSGWTVLHDIDVGRGNIDHVAVGPAGVFLIESKSLHGLLSVEKDVLFVRWREDPDEGYEIRYYGPRVRAAAAELARILGQHAGRVWVQPLIVLWGSFDQRAVESRRVAWVRGADLADVLGARPIQLSEAEVARLAATIRSAVAELARRHDTQRSRRAPRPDRGLRSASRPLRRSPGER